MTPIEQLDAAIAAGDIEAIKKARKLLSQQPQSDNEEEMEDSEIPIQDIPDDDGSGGDSKRICVKRPFDKTPRANKYRDSMEAPHTKKDLKKMQQFQRAPRERPVFKKVKMKCRECRNMYMVDPTTTIVNQRIEGDLITYLCSGCLRKKGGI